MEIRKLWVGVRILAAQARELASKVLCIECWCSIFSSLISNIRLLLIFTCKLMLKTICKVSYSCSGTENCPVMIVAHRVGLSGKRSQTTCPLNHLALTLLLPNSTTWMGSAALLWSFLFFLFVVINMLPCYCSCPLSLSVAHLWLAVHWLISWSPILISLIFWLLLRMDFGRSGIKRYWPWSFHLRTSQWDLCILRCLKSWLIGLLCVDQRFFGSVVT